MAFASITGCQALQAAWTGSFDEVRVAVTPTTSTNEDHDWKRSGGHRTIGFSELEITFMTRCGLIHDIGKIWMPAEILNAPRALTPDEWVIMRAHTTEGSHIVESVPLPAPFAPIVRGHHERLDGKGYPDGLRAEAIPLAARIVAVADCFNAMIGRRMYRPAMRPTKALSELARHRGTQFDPEIVDAMTQIVLGRLLETPARSAICAAT